MFFHKKAPHKTGCLAFHIGATVLLALAAIAALVGLIVAHYDPSDAALVFGTPASSLSIVAFSVTVALLMAQCKMCMTECDVCSPPSSVMPMLLAKKKKK